MSAGGADPPADDRDPVPDSRENLQVVEPDRSGRRQADSAHDPIPIALRVVGDAARVFPDVRDEGVVDPHGDGMPADGDLGPKIVGVSHRKGVV